MIKLHRKTKETDIKIQIENTIVESDLNSGIPFFDHMLSTFAHHSGISFNLEADGDLDIDNHHTVEDIGIVLGKALKQLINEKEKESSLTRFGQSYVPLDESLSRTVVDVIGRPHLTFNADFKRDNVGTFDTSMVKEFFSALSYSSGLNIHIDLIRGENDHHKIESIFKSFARALRMAMKPSDIKQSTKGDVSEDL